MKDMPEGMNDLREFMRLVDGCDTCRINFPGDFAKRVARNVSSLLSYWNTQRDTIRSMGEREIKSNDEIAALERRHEEFESDRAALLADLSRKSFEIQILQMTQGALKMEIDRLRAEAAPVTVYATDAVVTFGPAGVTLQAPMVEMHGDVTVSA
jgi:hypothetical protein